MFCNKRIPLLALFRKKAFFRQFSNLIDFKLADIGEGISEVELLQWYIKPGDKVEEFDPICEVQSDKATVDISSRYKGVVKDLKWKEGDTAKVGMPLVQIEVEEVNINNNNSNNINSNSNSNSNNNVVTNEQKYKDKTLVNEPDKNKNEKSLKVDFSKKNHMSQSIQATPAVRKLMREHNINVNDINATGLNGRVLKGDVLLHIEETYEEKKSNSSNMTSIQKAMFIAMEKSLEIPHFHYMEEYDFSNMIKYRDAMNQFTDSRLSYMPFIIKALSLTLNDFPIMFSSIDKKNMYINYGKTHDIGIAVDTEFGLFVPVIKEVENKSVVQIGKDLEILIEKGKTNKYTNDDLSGNKITLSNIGAIGNCTYATPIIPSGTLTIGAIGKLNKERETINISWAADHRLIDGATMARFSNTFHEHIQNPWK